jgi:hypothetical protein
LSESLLSAVSVPAGVFEVSVSFVFDFSVGFSTVVLVGFLGGSTCFSVDEFFSSGRIVDVVNGATVVGFAGGDVMFFSVDEFFSSCRIVDVVDGATVVGFAGGDVMFTFGGSVGFLSSI